MKKLFNLKTLLYWFVCIGTYLLTLILYAKHFQFQGTSITESGVVPFLTLLGILLALGTGLFLLLVGLNAIGKWIGMKKNLIFYFLYHLVFCTAYAFGTDYFLNAIKLNAPLLFLLIGFIAALLCSIIYSYHVSQTRRNKQ